MFSHINIIIIKHNIINLKHLKRNSINENLLNAVGFYLMNKFCFKFILKPEYTISPKTLFSISPVRKTEMTIATVRYSK